MRNKRRRLFILLDSILVAAAIFMLGYWFAKSESNTVIRIDLDTIQPTAVASPQTPVLQNTIYLSIRPNKTCYMYAEPIGMEVEIANAGDESVTVLKTLHFFTGGIYYGVTPMVNGKPNKALVQTFDERSDRSEDYVTLLPGEGAITHIPNFLNLIFELDGKPRESTTGQYDFAMQYWNWIPYVLHDFVFAGGYRFMFEMYGDRPVWTGRIDSNSLTITIVDHPEDCGTAIPGADFTLYPIPTLSWSR